MKTAKKIARWLALLCVGAVLWTAWACYALHDLAAALRYLDPVALESRVDWIGVRQGVRDDAALKSLKTKTDSFAPRNALAGVLGGALANVLEADLVGRTIGSFASQDATANLVQLTRLDDRGKAVAARGAWPGASTPAEPALSMKGISHAFFSGSPLAFRVDLAMKGEARPLVLLFKWTGDWRLARVFLPSIPDTEPRAVWPEPQQTPATPTPDNAPNVVVAPKPSAALYEEAASNPHGRQFPGSVIWLTEDSPPLAGGARDLAVSAYVSIPARPLAVMLSLRRNSDPALPASHTVEIKFDLPPDSPIRSIREVGGVMMTQSDDSIGGRRLAGLAVKVRENLFLMGLSSLELDTKQNLAALQERPRFEIPLIYENGSRAVLVIEKGPSGSKSIADALTKWATQAPTSNKDGQKDSQTVGQSRTPRAR